MKKKHVSMKKKSSWRKHTDINDVEEFLEDQRLQERIGANIEKTDAELFQEDKTPQNKSISLRQEKKLRALEPSKCFIALANNSKVEDPIRKRNRVKTPDERKHPLLKAKIQKQKDEGIIPKRQLQSIKDRIEAKSKMIKSKVKNKTFDKDLWADDVKDPILQGNQELNSMWVNDELKQYHLKNLGEDRVKVPKITHEKRSQLKAIEPIAGLSYNPNKEDYENIINSVVSTEEEFMKKSQKLNTSLKAVYQKISKSEIKRRKRAEMREGFPIANGFEVEKDEEPSDNEYKTLNPPVRNKKKDLKKRRKQKEFKERMARKEIEKNELKKLKDLGMLKMYKKQILKTENEIEKKKETRLKKQEQKKFEPRRLTRKKFEDEDIHVEDSVEALGNLRKIKPLGSILVDRFKSMQKRNILLPNIKRLPRKRRITKVKKNSHKEEIPQISKKMRKSNKIQIHD
ncbi:hypothetical protein PVAND_002513 [Polypedilum vanderplanki]|uniref:Ribosome biogenesis protein NOP53 n=1 Tax=Polypedilum vanderplanki TaxID=319348 RepID=A0A9J6BRX4_POLVA|nr:hypothetical protein PVAND_002513 [Polypedilum vanderplanki]